MSTINQGRNQGPEPQLEITNKEHKLEFTSHKAHLQRHISSILSVNTFTIPPFFLLKIFLLRPLKISNFVRYCANDIL